MEATLAELLTHVPAILRRPDGEILLWTEGSREIFGHATDEAIGHKAHELLRTEFPSSRESVQDELDAKGEWRGRLGHTASSGETVWTETVIRLRQSPTAGPVVVEQHTDITGRVALEERSALLARELEHRVMNILSVVQALARVTFAGAPAEQQRTLEDRLAALAEGNKLLHEGSWQAADLRAIVHEVARRLGIGERISLSGPNVAVSSQRAMGLALAFHELCTNALKYGALSEPAGGVEVAWQLADGDREQVRIVWTERGGPPVTPPSRTGFGMRLIRQALAGSSNAPAELRFEPDGLVCEMTLPDARGELS